MNAHVHMRLSSSARQFVVRKANCTENLVCYAAVGVVAGMGQWWSGVGAGVEQGRQCGLFGRICCSSFLFFSFISFLSLCVSYMFPLSSRLVSSHFISSPFYLILFVCPLLFVFVIDVFNYLQLVSLLLLLLFVYFVI